MVGEDQVMFPNFHECPLPEASGLGNLTWEDHELENDEELDEQIDKMVDKDLIKKMDDGLEV